MYDMAHRTPIPQHSTQRHITNHPISALSSTPILLTHTNTTTFSRFYVQVYLKWESPYNRHNSFVLQQSPSTKLNCLSSDFRNNVPRCCDSSLLPVAFACRCWLHFKHTRSPETRYPLKHCANSRLQQAQVLHRPVNNTMLIRAICLYTQNLSRISPARTSH